MEPIADPHFLDARVLRNPWKQNGPTIGTVPTGQPVMHYHRDHRQRFPFVMPSTQDEPLRGADGPTKRTFELIPEFDHELPAPWRAPVQAPPTVRFLIDTDGDGVNSLEESQANLSARGCMYQKSTAFSYGFSPHELRHGPGPHLGAQHYKYGEYDA